MSTILDRYGIKEVADVTFYKLNDAGKPTYPVLYLDTLKVSTIEQTAEQADARGGKGNPKLITWDYGKEITVTLEDALFSAKSMAIMFGDGTVKNYSGTDAYIMRTEQFIADATTTNLPSAGEESTIGWKPKYAHLGKEYTKKNPKFYTADGKALVTSVPQGEDSGAYTTAGFVKDERYFCTYDLVVKGAVIDISGNSFPGTYYVTGDTFARNEASGDDEFFQFIIPKAKVTSENTITLEAEGDPSVFNMNLTVLRPADGIMMKLVKYELDPTTGTEVSGDSSTAEVYHNHTLNGINEPSA